MPQKFINHLKYSITDSLNHLDPDFQKKLFNEIKKELDSNTTLTKHLAYLAGIITEVDKAQKEAGEDAVKIARANALAPLKKEIDNSLKKATLDFKQSYLRFDIASHMVEKLIKHLKALEFSIEKKFSLFNKIDNELQKHTNFFRSRPKLSRDTDKNTHHPNLPNTRLIEYKVDLYQSLPNNFSIKYISNANKYAHDNAVFFNTSTHRKRKNAVTLCAAKIHNLLEKSAGAK